MVKLSSKIISAVVGIAAAGAVSVTALNVSPATASKNDSSIGSAVMISSQVSVSTSAPTVISSSLRPVSSKASSPAVSTEGKVTTVSEGVAEIQKATDDGVSTIHQETQKAISQINAATPKKNSSVISYAPMKHSIVNPETGAAVFTDDPNYDKFRAELGGDAGTVSPFKSTACQAALARIRAKAASDSEAEKKKEESERAAEEASQPKIGFGQQASDQP